MKKRQWLVHHHVIIMAEAQQRWDHAYQYLVQWSAASLRAPFHENRCQERTNKSFYERLHQGWEWKDEHVFRDDGYSGASLRRLGLDRLRSHVSRAAFDRVIITAPDRLARISVHHMLLLEELQRGRCQIEFLDCSMSQDPHDDLL